MSKSLHCSSLGDHGEDALLHFNLTLPELGHVVRVFVTRGLPSAVADDSRPWLGQLGCVGGVASADAGCGWVVSKCELLK